MKVGGWLQGEEHKKICLRYTVYMYEILNEYIKNSLLKGGWHLREAMAEAVFISSLRTQNTQFICNSFTSHGDGQRYLQPDY